MISFELTKKAKDDLRNIAQYSEKKWGKTKRNHYIKQFDDCFHQLADNPTIGISVDYIHKGYFKFPQSSHMIFYILETDETIKIIRILHNRMDVKSHL